MNAASPPVAPSANSHVLCVAVTAVLSWPPSKVFQYIARSTAMFTLFVDLTTVKKVRSSSVSFVPSPFNRGLRSRESSTRPFFGTTSVCVSGPLTSRRYLTSTLAS